MKELSDRKMKFKFTDKELEVLLYALNETFNLTSANDHEKAKRLWTAADLNERFLIQYNLNKPKEELEV